MKRLVLAAALLACALPLPAAAQSRAAPVYEQPLSAQSVRDVQSRLRHLGYYAGPVDGVWGGETSTALARFQHDRRLPATGALNQATVTAMGLEPGQLVARGYAPRPEPRVATAAPVGPVTTRAVQERLRRLGYYHGPIDGVWGRGTALAFERFEQRNGYPAASTPTRQTLAALGLRPEDYMSGSTVPPNDRAEHLNHEELERQGR